MGIVKKTAEYRKAIVEFEENAKNVEGALVGEELNKYNPLKHTFADGYYIREVNTPAGQLLITKDNFDSKLKSMMGADNFKKATNPKLSSLIKNAIGTLYKKNSSIYKFQN